MERARHALEVLRARYGQLPKESDFSPATQFDVDLLVAVRIAAMWESLEPAGRFGPRRARERFLVSFDPALCRFIEADGVRVGFVLVHPQ